MRHAIVALIGCTAALAAGPALAQAGAPLPPVNALQLQMLQSQIEAQQDLAAHQMVGLQNQLSTLDAQRRADAAAAAIEAQSRAYPLPQPAPGAPAPVLDLASMASMPDNALAASTARARAASENRR